MADAYVQVAADGSGKKIRNISACVLQSDGTLATVYMQVTSIVDEKGNAVSFSSDLDLQQQMLDEMRAVRIGIQMLVDWMNPAAGSVQAQPVMTKTRVPLALTGSSSEEHELIEIARELRQDEDA